ncbi:MAG: hypothetical protein OEO77_13745, partial [Acidimicrobiia bacterium]|nr:hypothetical protein [Acidimicrobiia bacterium]
MSHDLVEVEGDGPPRPGRPGAHDDVVMSVYRATTRQIFLRLARVCWNSELILLYELAHVWEAQAVSPTRHEPFMAMRDGVKSWAGIDDAWEARGRAHAANVIAWGLLEDPYPVSLTYPNDPDSLLSAFRYLTNADPLHDGGP